MRVYIAKRVLLMIPVLLGVTALTFFFIRIAPGDIIDVLYEDAPVTEADLDEIRRDLGMDRSVFIQYVDWLWGVVRLDVGESQWTGRPVLGEVAHRLPVTIQLAFMALFLQFIIAIPVGVFAATHQDKIGDQIARFMAILGAAMPNFWIATIVIVYVAAWAGWLPPLGEVTPIWKDPWVNFQIVFIPAIVLGVSGSASMVRYTRNTLLEVIRQDYIRTAFAKGLTTRKVWYGHALKNALIPVVTIAGSHLGSLMGGTVIIENIFALPGLGQLVLHAIEQRDLPLLEFNVLVLAFIFAVTNLLVDLSYGWLDPRIRYG